MFHAFIEAGAGKINDEHAPANKKDLRFPFEPGTTVLTWKLFSHERSEGEMAWEAF